MAYQTVLEKINNSHIVFFGFDPSGSSSSNQWYRRFCILKSDNGIDFELIKYFPELQLADVDVLKFNETWYVIGTGAFYKTTDFETMTQLEMPLTTSSFPDFKAIWAPEFVLNHEDNTWHIVYFAQTTNGAFGMYLADFDPQTGTISNEFQNIDMPANSHIDPDILYLNGKYFLFSSGSNIYVSNCLAGPYSQISTDITRWGISGNLWYEAPEALLINGIVYLFQDKITGIMPGVGDSGYIVCRTASADDLSTWSDEMIVKAPLNIRHGCFKLINKKFSSETISGTILN